ncbi:MULTISPECIES: Cas10/Cmr2 second palm domain-containing protein [unclassified Microcoleus]|uniref:Cas10/Cmr2 second palm domain-containing protein n=1 Tax=unclassified Microcoleus TaxID=2642155 RepID=UPI002FD4D14E
MSKYIATVIDTTGIQKYIFGSNRLKENVAGSYLVKLATDDWVKECLADMGNVYIPDRNPSQAEPRINEKPEIIAELIYSGGGNTFLLFRDTEENYAIKFTEAWSKKILFQAPGLNVEIAHQSFNWNQRLLQNVIENDLIKGKLDIQKRKPRPSAPLLGLGVTASCVSTGLVAVEIREIDGVTKPISREVVKKLDKVNEANGELRKILFDDRKPRKRNEQYDIPLDVDDLGRSENESSYIAVVHIDGNQMGKRFESYGKSQSDNPKFIIAMRKLSWGVSEASRRALEAVGRAVIKLVDQEKFEIKDNYLPFRPIVYGGDDVTFVCDGRLGLSLAVKFLEKFEEFTQDLPDGKGKATACAGIAIVKTHYPFSRAYALSEALCSQAKQWMRQETNDYEKPLFSALDWHIAASGLLGSIGEIRDREYRVQIPDLDKPASLTMRPMRSHSCPKQWRTWAGFSQVLNDFNTHKDWKDRRNKVMALREVLRQGKKATAQFIQAYSLESLPAFTEANSDLAKEGWYKDICGYFDVIEAMDFYTSIEE